MKIKTSDLSAFSTNKILLPGDTLIRTEETHQLEREAEADTEDVLYSLNHFGKDRRFHTRFIYVYMYVCMYIYNIKCI